MAEGPNARRDSPAEEPEGPRALGAIDRERFGIIFIVVMIVVLGIAVVSGAVGLTGLVIVGALLGLLLVVGYRRDESKPVEVAANPDRVRRVLVLANEGLGGARLREALDRSHGNGSELHVRVIVPALASPLSRLTDDVDDEVGRADVDVERLLSEVRSSGLEADGEVGDSDPSRALEDALRTYPADEIVVVNPADDSMGRMERAVTSRAKDATPIPVTELHV